MSGKDEGVFVPRRVIFIMILVFLCVNVFFLMMGILIGKDDIKWKASQDGKTPQDQAAVDEKVATQDSLTKDLSLFEGEPADDDTRRPPIPAEALKSDGVVPVPQPKSEPDETQADPQSNTGEASAVDPPKTKPEPAKAESQPEPVKSQPEPVKVEAKSEPKKVAPKPVATEVAKTTASGYWIQVMAIGDAEKARTFLEKAKSKGFKGVMINEKGLYKVRIGPYGDRAAADKAKDQANSSLGVGGWVIQK